MERRQFSGGMQGKNLRYLKQIKQRNTEERYGADNVCLFQINKPDCFLQYEFVDYSREWEHLRQLTDKDRDELKEKVTELKQQGKSLREIAAVLGISKAKVEWLLKSAS